MKHKVIFLLMQKNKSPVDVLKNFKQLWKHSAVVRVSTEETRVCEKFSLSF